MGKIIGIDLGTTKSVVAAWRERGPVVVPNAEGDRLTPSVAAIDKKGHRLVGLQAKRQAATNPENTIFSIKRLMGRKFKEPSVQFDMKRLPYEITEAPNGDCLIVMGGKKYYPLEISAMILQKLKTDAEAYLGEKITDAVITVPAYFNDRQRQATKDAGAIAGLNVVRIINEPTASSLAYGLDKKKEAIVAVYHLGGGTFDISILEMGEGTFQVKSTSGDTHLGGDDFDRGIMDWLCDEFKKQSGIELRQDRIALQRVRDAAEKAKIELSAIKQTEVKLPYIAVDASGPRDLNIVLTRSKMEQLVVELVDKSIGPCRQALQDAGLTPAQINEVLLVGGQTRTPLVQAKVARFFAHEPKKGVNADEAVALGAAILGGVLKGEVREVLLLDVTPLTLGIETLGGVATPLIPRNTTIPTSKSQVFSTAANNQTSIDVHVVQGERPMAGDNRTLGRFRLDGILPAPRNMPQIEVAFDIDANGILSVSARDKDTGRQQKITITASSGISKQELERMTVDAKQHAAAELRRSEESKLASAVPHMVADSESQGEPSKRVIAEAGSPNPTTGFTSRFCRAMQKNVSIVADPEHPICLETCTKEGSCDNRPCKWALMNTLGAKIRAHTSKTEDFQIEWMANLLRVDFPFLVDYTETAWDPCSIPMARCKSKESVTMMADNESVATGDIAMPCSLRDDCLRMTIEYGDLIFYGFGISGYDNDPRGLFQIPDVTRWIQRCEKEIPDFACWVHPSSMGWYAQAVFNGSQRTTNANGLSTDFYRQWVQGSIMAATKSLQGRGASPALVQRATDSMWHKAGWALHEGWGAWFQGAPYRQDLASRLWQEHRPMITLENADYNAALIDRIRKEALSTTRE